MKNKILSISVEQRVDECPDTPWIGKYSDQAKPWNIDRQTERFVISEIKRDELLELLYERIEEKENGNENFKKINIEATKKRIEKLENCLDKSPIGRNELEYFEPYAGGEKSGSPEYKKYAFQDYNRMESYNRCDWCFVGIIAKATIQTETGILQHITSGGLWGIESDSGDYLNEVAKEEIESLKKELSALGFSKRAVQYAVNRWNGEIISK